MLVAALLVVPLPLVLGVREPTAAALVMAIVGDPDQVLAKLRQYQAMGIEAFILSGYPHAAEADLFALHVLPRLDHAPLIREPESSPAGS